MKRAASIIVSAMVVAAVPISPGATVKAETTKSRGFFSLLDVGIPSDGGHFDQTKSDVRILRDASLDSLLDASQVVIAGTNFLNGPYPAATSGCAIMTGDLWCWGENSSGRLGDGTVATSTSPKRVLEGVKDVYSTTRHTCAVRTTGDLVCAGGDELVNNEPVVDSVDVDGRTTLRQATSFGSVIRTGVVSIVDNGLPCISTINRRMLCAGKTTGRVSKFPSASAWTWVDTGLRSDGQIAVAYSPVINNNATSGHAGSSHGTTASRVVCAADGGSVSCTMMNPANISGYVDPTDFEPTFGDPQTIPGVGNVTQLFEASGLLFADSDGVAYRADANLVNGIPKFFEAIAAVPGFLGVVSHPVTALVTETGLLGVEFDEKATFHEGTVLYPLTRFGGSTSSDFNRIVRVLARTNSALAVSMEVSSGARKSRGPTKVRVLAGDVPTVGAYVSWRSADISSVTSWSPESELSTDSNGEVVLPNIATGPVLFTVWGGVSAGSYLKVAGVLTVVNDSGEVVIRLPAPPKSTNQQFRVVTALGEPVPSAVVTLNNLHRTFTSATDPNGAAAWALSVPVRGLHPVPNCPYCFAPAPSLITGEDGTVRFRVYETVRRWRAYVEETKRYEDADVTVRFDDGTARGSTFAVISSSTQTVMLDVMVSANITGPRDVVIGSKGGSLKHDGGASTVGLQIEEVCDAVVSGGLWRSEESFTSKRCSAKYVFVESVSPRSGNFRCSGSVASGNSVRVCAKRSTFVRLRASGRAPSRTVCLVVAGKPCVTRTSVFYGVPVVLKSGRSVVLRELVSAAKTDKVSASISGSSTKLCRIVGPRLTALKGAGTCSIVVTRTRGKRSYISIVRVLVAR
jgi:hypothetical protein